MRQLLYFSRATEPVTAADLTTLVGLARHANEQTGITGILLHEERDFIHLLEGEEPVVRSLYERICLDSRHQVVALHRDKAIVSRSFAGQPLARHELSPRRFLELARLISVKELFLHSVSLSKADRNLLHLLRAFVLPVFQF